MPSALAHLPELPTYLRHYHTAYTVLHDSRGIGFSGYQPITIEAMDAYCRMQDISDAKLFVFLIQAMDVELLKYWREKEGQARGSRS